MLVGVITTAVYVFLFKGWFFIPGTAPLPAMECLKIIAVFRYLFPRQEIKIAGGRETSLRDLQSWMFLAGADSFLIGNYLTTCGRTPEEDLQMVRDLGLTIGGCKSPAVPLSRTGSPQYVAHVL